MSDRLSLQKCDQILARALKAHESGKKALKLSTKELIALLKYIRSLHTTMRDVQLDLLQGSFQNDLEALQSAADASLDRIEKQLGPIKTLFEDISEVEISEFSDVDEE